MSGPAPLYQPTFTGAQVAICQQQLRRHAAPQAQVYRAKVALVLHAHPALDNVTAGQRLGKHANWVRFWRRLWATEGFRLTDRPGRGRKPAVSPPSTGDGGGPGLRVAGPARPALESVQHRRPGAADR